MYFNRINILQKKPIFKKRGTPKIIKAVYPSKKHTIFVKNIKYIELNVLRSLIVNLKRLSKRKYIVFFFNIKKTHFLSKKSKNSRMGKGKGAYIRYVYTVKINKPIIEVRGLSNTRFSKIVPMLIGLDKKTVYVKI